MDYELDLVLLWCHRVESVHLWYKEPTSATPPVAGWRLLETSGLNAQHAQRTARRTPPGAGARTALPEPEMISER